ncbi:ExbD/TolR family protein [Thalassoglobus polymorphus]|uniref:Biopolymer transport protein ExbD n=1 Tax=Thalassoglobus polymorphus TaxID=2527994 RepID=A0A517QIZ0_9PLAN|nr:biopolymer transporter ExbD [Thalassoglobus polymorphus]QDT31620.1 biopolymer transport protein ExbD [Thalassoglobus polymorphus]
MRLPVRSRKHGLKVDITPLIDVVFLLVIFFLVASHFAKSEPTEVVELPTATQSTDDENPRRLIVTVNSAGEYYVNAEQVQMGQIEEMIQDGAEGDPETYAVRIRGDRTTPYSAIEPIMLICPKYGVTKFGFHVIGRG